MRRWRGSVPPHHCNLFCDHADQTRKSRVGCVDASQNIVPLLHAFSCEDLDPHALPGDWDADEGRDYETGCLPYYQTLVLVRAVLGERLPEW